LYIYVFEIDCFEIKYGFLRNHCFTGDTIICTSVFSKRSEVEWVRSKDTNISNFSGLNLLTPGKDGSTSSKRGMDSLSIGKLTLTG
jgi:hypothetical protein